MKIAAVQMVSGPSLQPNLQAAAALVSEAAAAGARLVALPEYFCLLGRRDTDKLEVAEAPGRGPIQQALAGWAREHGIWIIGGTLPIAATAGGAAAASGTAAAASDDAARAAASAGPAPAARALNRSVVVAPDGRFVAHYDKLHLFAFDNGRESYDEGRTLRAGERPVAVQCGPLRVGLSICYDLRFPELYRALMQPPCDLLVVPAAFTHTTGQAHWEILLRARAVENQCYVLAAAQGGTHGNGRRTWGRSMIVDPWGEVLAVRDEGEGVVVADVEPARIEAVRRQLPALAHRRL
ncbi:MAG: carbon-nitrogen hydrolase family protein [Pseudomonadota bacterium]|jgi:predicted amidohydrolase|nr:carbon-nitrogen hydrolase family protein [Rubrivivax sp.]MCA3259298.1 carbon-nitrogen hydrolase family protein [Rubrivivax sp.]MCE2913730.1 carbon-nitrogen hydrolase family protein [Rubrivivax sp.]MCZ8031297.1 carbon-nitrogen hydrolase family protein [Rubrivivax sp.]